MWTRVPAGCLGTGIHEDHRQAAHIREAAAFIAAEAEGARAVLRAGGVTPSGRPAAGRNGVRRDGAQDQASARRHR